MIMAYEIRDHEVYRDGVKVAEFTGEGVMTMMEGCEDYRLPAGKAVREFLGEQWDEVQREQRESPPESKPVRTVWELVEAMQKYTSDPCPPFSNFYGDRTPEVQEWIRSHDDIRRNVLRQRGNE